MKENENGRWPRRLMYIGDVPPTNTLGGSLLLYRLFEAHPAERLIVVTPHCSGEPVAAAEWIPMRRPLDRLMRTRLVSAAALLETAGRSLPCFSLGRVIRRFQPEAIVTVWHGAGWIRAFWAARRHRLPLALIVHDEATTSLHALPRCLERWRQGVLGKFYRGASVRFCVSREMASEYGDRYGISSRVLSPSLSRGAEIPVEARPQTARRPQTFLYAGSIHSGGVQESLAALGRRVAGCGGRLVIFTTAAKGLRGDPRFCRDGVEVKDIVPPGDLVAFIRGEADVLVAIVDQRIGLNGKLLFPTKLVEYTAHGLPILLFAPPGSAASNWAMGPPVRAISISQPCTDDELGRALSALGDDGPLRESLANAALDAARSTFAHGVVFDIFREGIEEAVASRAVSPD